ncbi:unnamed protein product, partial [Musa acuminata subsp. burmannicoides]
GTTPTPADASQSSQQNLKTSKEDASSSSYMVSTPAQTTVDEKSTTQESNLSRIKSPQPS